MQTEDRSEFGRVLVGMASVFGTELSKEGVSLWWSCLKDWPLDEFKSAATHLTKTSDFMPKPGAFEKLRAASGDSPHEAWDKVLTHIQGAYRFGGISPEIDRSVHCIGGYRNLAMANTDTLHFHRRTFVEAYLDSKQIDHSREAIGSTTRIGDATKVSNLVKLEEG